MNDQPAQTAPAQPTVSFKPPYPPMMRPSTSTQAPVSSSSALPPTPEPPQVGSYVDHYQPPTAVAPTTEPAPAAAEAPAEDQQSATTVSQALEDQNIFHLLGVTDGNEQERETFLDELQQVVWDDFLDNDVELLITEEELQDLRRILANKQVTQLEQQEQVIAFLEKLIPDLEEIMLEKALELKGDMVRERIAGMREYFAQKPEALAKIDQAAALIADNQWRAAAELLNAIA